MKNTLSTVDFYGDRIPVVAQDGNVLVPLRPICQAIGLDWSKQLKNLKDDAVLAGIVATVATMPDHDALKREYKYICLPLSYLNGWLFRLNAGNFAEPKRSRIISYQKDCYRVLAEHFLSAERRAPSATDERLMADYRRTTARLEVYAARVRFELRHFCRRYDLNEESCIDLLRQAFANGPTTVGGLYDFGVWNCAPVPDSYYDWYYRREDGHQSPFGGYLNEILRGKYLPRGGEF